ncbi:hypothetical protein Forpi1262_v003529 [Fusarium oxysporum f. sp. raphani]|uniref:Peptidase S9 prolyl oligopeptidase catalytic domain-containing protein n=1 Tax=Fusarium oxysporum f. sp. raphani TaxID=96318 RepID=A0A8J5Q7Z0_FUSOX|nr:hypothetical protein Forpi1262_v003529 [Fusarium oxysporum f. sp. raphani]
MLSQGTVPLACRQGGLCPEHTGPVRLDGAVWSGLDPQTRPDQTIPITVQNFTARGEGKSQQSILVVQGLKDVSVLPEVVEESYRVGCRSRNELHLQLYPGMDHDPVIAAASPYFLQWIDDRFSGVTTSGKCTNHTTQPFDAVNMYAPDDTD